VNGLVYAIGGSNGVGSPLNTVEVYNPASNSWSTAASMPTARFGLAAATVNGLIYAVGGYNGSPSGLFAAEVYNPSSNSWTSVFGLTPRYGLAAVAMNGFIYAMGGFNPNAVSTVEVYNPTSNSWSPAANMPTASGGLAADAANGLIYAMGGFPITGLGANFLNTVQIYNPSSNAWSTAAAMLTPRDNLAAADVNGLIYAIGGYNNNPLNAVEQYWPPVTVYTFIKN
jgi:N-acetylneuraminic acid mutarotase